jgi:glycosyltransferase involved in cell wall biosynthesis
MSLQLHKTKTVGRSASLETPLFSRRPKVLHVGKFYPPHMGGIETHLQALSEQLIGSLDLNVLVASDCRRQAREVLAGVRVLRVATPLTLFSTPLCPALISAIRASDAELLHIHLPNPTAVMAYLASGHRGRLVFTYHSDTVRQRVLGSLFEPFLHAALRRSSAIIATSPNYLETSQVLQAHRDRCHVIPYGIDTGQFQYCSPGSVARLRQQYGDRVVLAVGRLVYYKGFEYLIRAMKDVRGKLVLVGDGPLRGHLENLASQLGVTEKVVFAGEIHNANVVPYYHATDIFALPSVARSEAFGIVQIEAMAAGLPVVNTSLDSGVPFVSVHKETGLTVPPADVPALADALNRLLDDVDLRKSLGQAGRLRAQQEFNSKTMASRTLRLYQTVIAGTDPAPSDGR